MCRFHFIIGWLIVITALVPLIVHHVSGEDKFRHISAVILFGGLFAHIVGTFLYALIITFFENKNSADNRKH